MSVPVHIKNPFTHLKGYNCFGCSPDNPLGLHMHFRLEGDEMICDWEPTPDYQGWFKILHGGIQATLMDEIAGWLVLVKLKTSGVTAQMEVRYLKPVRTDNGMVRIRARLLSHEGKKAVIRVELYNAEGVLCTEGDLHYYVYPLEIARERLYYPASPDAFLETGGVEKA